MTVQSDETAIRELIATWLRTSSEGDTETLGTLMADDVVFLVAGQPPMRGREAFMTSFKSLLPKFRIDGTSQIEEIQVTGEWAYCWTRLSVTMTPLQGGAAGRRSGNTLTILHREPDGHWVIFRDANLLAAES